jgi:hypothetical protein
MKCSTSLLLPVVAACSVALSSYGGTVVSDTWNDNDRTDPAQPVYSEMGTDADLDGNIESLWYRGGSGTLTTTAGHLIGGVAASSGSWSTWFTTPGNYLTLVNPGDQIKVTWNFSMSGLNAGNANQGLRLALANSSAITRRTSDNSPADGAYAGYSQMMNVAPTLNQANPFQLLERNSTSATGGFLSSSGNWTGLANNGATGDAGYAAGTAYSFVMTLTLGAGGALDIVSTMSGTGLGPGGVGYLTTSYSDLTPSTLQYDLFGLRPATSSALATTVDTTLFQVEFIPEPSTFALIGLGLLSLGFGYRRSRR